MAVRVDERAHALPPRLVGRRDDLLAPGRAKVGGRGVDVVGVDPEREVGPVRPGSPGEADAVRLQRQEDELQSMLVLVAIRLLEAERGGVPLARSTSSTIRIGNASRNAVTPPPTRRVRRG